MLRVSCATSAPSRCAPHSGSPTRITVPLPSSTALSAERTRAGARSGLAGLLGVSGLGRRRRATCTRSNGVGLLEPREAGQVDARQQAECRPRRRSAEQRLGRAPQARTRAPNGSAAVGGSGRSGRLAADRDAAPQRVRAEHATRPPSVDVRAAAAERARSRPSAAGRRAARPRAPVSAGARRGEVEVGRHVVAGSSGGRGTRAAARPRPRSRPAARRPSRRG